MTLNLANNILLESSLPSWGGMLADRRAYMQTAWWVAVFPGLAIMVTGRCFNFLGDLLDPTRANA